MNKKTINDIYVDGMRVLIRVDYSVPINKEGAIMDDSRIRETLPTIRLLSVKGAAIVLMAHFRRSEGEYSDSVDLVPLSRCLQALLNHDVSFVDSKNAFEVEAIVKAMGPGQILLLENLLFNLHEETNDVFIAEQLAHLTDAYVCDAFEAAHRTHATTEGVVRIMRAQGKPCVLGLNMERELNALEQLHDEQLLPGLAVIDDKVP